MLPHCYCLLVSSSPHLQVASPIHSRGRSSTAFSPLKYLANLKVRSQAAENMNMNDIMTVTVHKATTRVAIVSSPVDTGGMFQALGLTLYFNSTQVNLDGLQNQTWNVDLNKGFYIISFTLGYKVLPNFTDASSAYWTVTLTGD